MIEDSQFRKKITADLGLERTMAKGQNVAVNNCWHFFTAGDSVDVMFHNDNEFRDGMNRILPVSRNYEVTILAFVLMDTHIHFILYGDFDSCNRFIHEYIRRTSLYLSRIYNSRNAMKDIEISNQRIGDERYLKTAITYVLKNPLSAGLPYNPWDYPWSSGALYFRNPHYWTTPLWRSGIETTVLKVNEIRSLTKSKEKIGTGIRVIDGLIIPDQYVAVAVVEKLFRSHKAFNYFLAIAKDVEIESRGGAISNLTIPLSEMRDNRRALTMEMFGVSELRLLSMGQRVRLAKRMRKQYNCSPKQIAKLCGLVYDEVIDLLKIQ